MSAPMVGGSASAGPAYPLGQARIRERGTGMGDVLAVIGEVDASASLNTVLRVGRLVEGGGWMQTEYIVLTPAERDRLVADLTPTEIAAPASRDPMPVFVLKGKDGLAPDAIDYYRRECLRHGLVEQARQVGLAWLEMDEWQARHPELVKLPRHEHVPAAVPGWNGGEPR